MDDPLFIIALIGVLFAPSLVKGVTIWQLNQSYDSVTSLSDFFFLHKQDGTLESRRDILTNIVQGLIPAGVLAWIVFGLLPGLADLDLWLRLMPIIVLVVLIGMGVVRAIQQMATPTLKMDPFMQEVLLQGRDGTRRIPFSKIEQAVASANGRTYRVVLQLRDGEDIVVGRYHMGRRTARRAQANTTAVAQHINAVLSNG